MDKNIWKDTRRIFWFSTLTSLMGSMNLFADAFIAGNLGENVIKAIGVVGFSLPLIMSINIFLSVATAGHIAQSITSNEDEHAQKSFDFSLSLSLVAIAIAGLLMFALQDSLISWRTNDPELIRLSNQYYWLEVSSVLLRFYAIRFNILFSVKGYQGRLTFLTLATIATNVLVSGLLAYTAGLGIIGTGIGTLVSIAFVMLIKIYMVFSIRKEFNVKLGPFRFIHGKFKQIKILKKTWIYLPYEFVFSIIVVGQSFVLTNMFENGLALMSMASGMIFTIVGANGASTMMDKLVSPLLGKGDTVSAKEMSEKILMVSTIRQFFVSMMYVLVFGLALPYIHLYNAPHETLVHVGYIVIGAGMTAGIMAPSFYTGYGLASLSANPKRASFIDLSATLFSLLIYYVGSVISISWVSIMLTMMIHRIVADTAMVSLVFRKDQYISLKKEMA